MTNKTTNKKGDPQIVDVDHYPDGFKFIAREWHVIKGAPAAFVLCLIVVGAVIWFVIDRLYDAELRAKDATIETLSLRPESNKSQTKETQRLRAEIKALQDKESYRIVTEWQPLSDEQIEVWRKALAPHKIESVSLFWTHAEGSQFYASVSRALKDSGCKVTHESGSSGSREPGSSEFIVYASPDDPVGEVVLSLLNQSGYKAKMNKEVIDWKQWRKDGNSQITIFVGAKN